ncbi:thaumatin-like protein 1b [Juglans microcarpa x Juglans regia]|uniref:thaumatin-like protein 1b n=1 Tax=Juglans microcarpa x Juglans regia TaxID=2249226 RepID=UPI001B7F598D|nr:thaumatin-like protein 1b [Juglans microcarpa x Juglans regia]XP_041022284.1 thaumatin-like protein 1b [Juglans microcarpa x Juglans regia]
MNSCHVLSVTGLILLTISSLSEAGSASFKIVNNCRRTIWPGLLTSMTGQLPTTGFALKSGESKNISIPKPWTGRLWGRTHCVQDSSGKFTCLTGDCGSEAIECGGGPYPPVTMAEFSLENLGGMDFYDVSVVDGFNLPMLVEVKGPSGVCDTAGCLVDLNGACPMVLSVLAGEDGRVGEVVACRNGCGVEASSDPAAVASKCDRKLYSKIFRSACPRAYTNPYDDKIGTLVCTSAEYVVTFCP